MPPTKKSKKKNNDDDGGVDPKGDGLAINNAPHFNSPANLLRLCPISLSGGTYYFIPFVNAGNQQYPGFYVLTPEYTRLPFSLKQFKTDTTSNFSASIELQIGEGGQPAWPGHQEFYDRIISYAKKAMDDIFNSARSQNDPLLVKAHVAYDVPSDAFFWKLKSVWKVAKNKEKVEDPSRVNLKLTVNRDRMPNVKVFMDDSKDHITADKMEQYGIKAPFYGRFMIELQGLTVNQGTFGLKCQLHQMRVITDTDKLPSFVSKPATLNEIGDFDMV